MATLEERIKEFNNRHSKRFLKIKYERLSENAFSFLRGTCHLFYEDVSKETWLNEQAPLTWICGDLHLENFGSYKADNRLVYFDLNDFGEAILAPVTWEIVRVITSIFVAFDSLKMEREQAGQMAELFLKKYAKTLKKGKARYIEPKVAKGVVQVFLNTVERRKQKELLEKRTIWKGNKLRLLIDNNRHFKLPENLKVELQQHFKNWKTEHKALRHFRCIDIAVHVAGTGSLGIKRYCFLLQGVEKTNKYLLLDMKEAIPSCLAPHVNTAQPGWINEAERICTIQEYMQNNCPALLSATSFLDSSFIIQELQPSSDKINFKQVNDRYRDIAAVINDMAVLTASSQLRSSGRKGSAVADDLIAFGTDQGWHKNMLACSNAYSDEIKRYYKEYVKKYSNGVFKTKAIQ